MASDLKTKQIASSDQIESAFDLIDGPPGLPAFFSKQIADILLDFRGKRHYRSNSLVQEGIHTKPRSFYVKDGLLKLYKHDEYGAEVVILVFGPGELIINAIKQFNGFQSLHIACLTDATLIPLDQQALSNALSTDAEFLLNILKLQNDYFLTASDRFRKDQSEAVNKILATMIYIASKWSSNQRNIDFVAQIGHQQFATLANVARETFSRVLSKLKANDYIITDDGGSMALADKAFKRISESFFD